MDNIYFSFLIVSPDKKQWTAGVTDNPPRYMDDYANAFDQQGNSPHLHDIMAYLEKRDSKEDAEKRAEELKNLSHEDKVSLVEKNNPNWSNMDYKDWAVPSYWLDSIGENFVDK